MIYLGPNTLSTYTLSPLVQKPTQQNSLADI